MSSELHLPPFSFRSSDPKLPPHVLGDPCPGRGPPGQGPLGPLRPGLIVTAAEGSQRSEAKRRRSQRRRRRSVPSLSPSPLGWGLKGAGVTLIKVVLSPGEGAVAEAVKADTLACRRRHAVGRPLRGGEGGPGEREHSPGGLAAAGGAA